MKNIIVSRAPVRICDLGGWTDTWYYPKGAVFNFCVDLYSYTRIIRNNLNTIRIYAENLEETIEILDFNNIQFDGKLDLLKAAVKLSKIDEGIDIFVRADAPPGCGTGTSASVAVSLIAALAHYEKTFLTKQEIAQRAHNLETIDLKLESGVQDQFAASYGGINFMEIEYPKVKIHPIKVSESRIFEIESQFILVFLSSRSSSEMHRAVIKKYENKEETTINAFEIMKNCAISMKKAINSDITDVGEVMYKNWEAQKSLHSLMVNPIIEKAERIAREHNALGFKVNGAGGGGSATILADMGKEYILKKTLSEYGFKILPFKLCFKGVNAFSL
jgi:D-glycero-alpha-D-manno-heptose-7-phosphate kinase